MWKPRFWRARVPTQRLKSAGTAAGEPNDTGAGYRAAIDLWVASGNQNWSRFGAMLVAHSVIFGVIAQTLAEKISFDWPIPLALPVAGFLLCGLWLAAVNRGLAYQDYYVRKAREFEARLTTVDVVGQGECVPMTGFARLKTRRAMQGAIGLFALLYVTAALLMVVKNMKGLVPQMGNATTASEALKMIVPGIPGLVGVVLGAALVGVKEWWRGRKRRRSYWSALSAEVDLCAGLARANVDSDVAAPLYRLPMIAYASGFPALLGDGCGVASSLRQIENPARLVVCLPNGPSPSLCGGLGFDFLGGDVESMLSETQKN